MKKKYLTSESKHLLLLIEKIPNTMKLTFLFLVISLLSFTAKASAQKVSIALDNVKVETVLSAISQQTGLSMAYSKQIVNLNRRISIHVTDVELNQALDKLVSGTNLNYEVKNGKIYLFEKKSTETSTTQQKRKITGTVTDQSGEVIIGANVVEKGTSNGTISDADGNFTLEISGKEPLVISYIGYNMQEVTVTNQTNLNIRLVEDTKMIDEVVVIGYGQQRRSEITTSISKVTSDDFIKGSVKSAEQLIQGKVAGLQVVNSSGDPTSDIQMMLRGVSTLSSSTAPLIIIDGIPGGVLSAIAPEDIESIDVLKDGSAAAIYGTRGTNGVVIVTTKRNNGSGKMTLDYNGYLSVNTIKNKIDVLSASEYKNLKNDSQFIENNVNILDYGDDVNYVDEILRTPISQSHNLSIRGGDMNSNYSASVTYKQNQGIILNSDRDQLNVKASVNHAMFNNRLKINLNINNATGKDNLVGERGVYVGAIQRNPTIPIYNEDGSYVDTYGMPSNPVALLKEETREKEWNRLLASGKITLSPFEGLNISAMGAMQRYDTEYNASRTKKHPSFAQNGTLPNATLTVFTAEQNKAEFECKEKYGLKDVVIKYIPQDRIQEELSQFKYGFILRKDISVNNVATPTKLNSYMSAGIIPIVSESLNDFINHSYLCKYIIRINNIEAFENNAVQIKKFEERKLNAVDVLDDFNKLFMSYYNKENYMNELSEVLSNYESNTFD